LATYRMIVRVNPAVGCADDFNRWYDSEHLAHVLAVPGFRSYARFRVAHARGGRLFQYCTVFDIDTDEIATVMAELQARTVDGRMPLSPTMDPIVEFEILEPLTSEPPTRSAT
jgi:hypothetical protein